MGTPVTMSIAILWALRVLMAALFLLAGIMKLTGHPMMVSEFDQLGVGQWSRVFTGAVELAGAIGILVPRFSFFGACALLMVDLGAFVAQVAILHMDWIHTIVIGAVLVVVVYLQRDAIVRRSGPLPKRND